MASQRSVPSSALRILVGVAMVLAIPAIAMLVGDAVRWTLADFVLAGVLLAVVGVAVDLALRQSGNLAVSLGVAALGVAACLAGQADDAPGLVVMGLLLVASGLAMAARHRRRAG